MVKRVRLYIPLFLALHFFIGMEPALAQKSGELPPIFEGVGLDQRLGEAIPDTLAFYDETGRLVRLSDYFNTGKPVLLSLAYQTCEMLCSVLLNGLTSTLGEMDWTPGEEFEVLTISFSAKDTPEVAAQQKAHYLDILGKPEAGEGWHFLTGSEASILTLAEAIGFRFKWVEEIQQYAHPATLTILTADGKISRYIQGLSFEARTVRLALLEASDGTIGSPIDQVTLYCLRYDPEANSYVLQATNLMKLGGLLTVLVLGLALVLFWKREQARLATSALK
ncbi:MAG: SCO family protein [Rhodothermales bacterium]